MRKPGIILFTVMSLFIGVAIADTLELADGTLLEGDFVGSSNGIIMFNTGDGIEAFPEAEVPLSNVIRFIVCLHKKYRQGNSQ